MIKDELGRIERAGVIAKETGSTKRNVIRVWRELTHFAEEQVDLGLSFFLSQDILVRVGQVSVPILNEGMILPCGLVYREVAKRLELTSLEVAGIVDKSLDMIYNGILVGEYTYITGLLLGRSDGLLHIGDSLKRVARGRYILSLVLSRGLRERLVSYRRDVMVG